MADTFTGPELEKALADGSLSSSGLTLTGVVKTSDTKGHISFSAGDPNSWVDIPVALIEEAENLGQCDCPGEKHPVMRLRLTDPSGATEVTLTALLAQAQTHTMSAGAEAAISGPVVAAYPGGSGYPAYPAYPGGPLPGPDAPSMTAMRLGGGGAFGGFGGGQFDRRRTLPICGWVSYVCGSSLPGYPPITCQTYCCYYPSSGISTCPDGQIPTRTF
jgi:hypothetical protein